MVPLVEEMTVSDGMKQMAAAAFFPVAGENCVLQLFVIIYTKTGWGRKEAGQNCVSFC